MIREIGVAMPFWLDRPDEEAVEIAITAERAGIETVWVGLFAIASEVGLSRLGRITIDSSKMRADAGPEAVVKAEEFDELLTQLRHILKQAETADTQEESDAPGSTRLQKEVEPQQMRDILRRVRKARAHPRVLRPLPLWKGR